MQRKVKLLFVVEAMGGGVFTYIVDLVNVLVDQYDMYIAYSIRPQTPRDYKDYFDKRIHLIEVKNFTRSLQLMKDIKAFFEIRQIANQIHPDIIHLHSSKAGALGRWAFNGKKTPLFYTPHGYSFLMQNHSTFKRFAYKIIEKLCAKRCCTTISCSEGEHKETLKLMKHAVYVNNGINVEALQKLLPSIQTEASKTFTVFTLGRICYQKNPVLFNQIAETMPDVHFLWIGDGEMKNELTASNIEITGWMDREDALTISALADAFLLTSLWEGLPISLLEAMYMKKPCVVNDVIGNHDVIHNGVNGYVCNQVLEFSNAIEQIRVGNASDLIRTAYNDILNQYNTVVMAKEYTLIYDKALGIIGGGYHLTDIVLHFFDVEDITFEKVVV